MQTNNRKRSSISGLRALGNSTVGDDAVFRSGKKWQDSIDEEKGAEAELQREAEELRRKLREAQKQLGESEAELAQLRATVESQSSQLHMYATFRGKIFLLIRKLLKIYHRCHFY